MLTHGSGKTFSSCSGRHHIAAITDMLTRSCLIGLDVISAQNSPIVLEHEGLAWCRQPKLPGLVFGDVSRVRVGLSRCGDLAENGPDVIKIFCRSFSDAHEYSIRFGLADGRDRGRFKHK